MEALFSNVPSASRQWMAAQVHAFPRINIDILILTLIHGCCFIWLGIRSGSERSGSHRLCSMNRMICLPFLMKCDHHFFLLGV